MKTQYLYLKDEKNRIIDMRLVTEDNLQIFDTYLKKDFEDSEIEKINLAFAQIDNLMYLLQWSDWKVAVNSEYIQAGLEPKYPDLHKERQAWRDEINKLERDLEV